MIMSNIVGIILIAGGILGLVYRHFSLTQKTHAAKLGPLALSVTNKRIVVPVWAGVGSIVIGSMFLLL